MAHAIAQAQRESLTINQTGYEITYAVTFAGTDVDGGQSLTGATVSFDFGDTNDVLRSKVRRGVEQAATESGVTVESVQADVLIAL